MKMKMIPSFLSRGYLLELIVMLIQCWKWLATIIQSSFSSYSNEPFDKSFDSNLNTRVYWHGIVFGINVISITQTTFYHTIQKSFNTTTKNQTDFWNSHVSPEYIFTCHQNVFQGIFHSCCSLLQRILTMTKIGPISTFGSSILWIVWLMLERIVSLMLLTLLLWRRFWAAKLHPILTCPDMSYRLMWLLW